MPFYEYADKSLQEVLSQLKSSESGLSKKEAGLRLKTFGLNEIKARNTSWLEVLIRQFKSPFFYLLFAAVAVSFFIGEIVDSITFSAFIAINVIIGFLQEYKAEKSIFLLNGLVPQKTKVSRDSKISIIDRKFLVPGDIVLLEAGDSVPADMRTIEVRNFFVDESVLTGESSPVAKIIEKCANVKEQIFRAENIIFSGSMATSGKAQGVVIATGKETAFGNIAKSISEIKRESSYEKNISYFCKLILKIVVVTISLVFIVNILFKGLNNVFDILLFCVALIVSILPEALPAVVTFSLSKGSLQMAKENVVVKRLSAIEDLGNIDILCTDKTGTLTQNKLSLQKTASSDKKKCFLYGVLSCGHSLENNRTTGKILNHLDAAIMRRAPEDTLNSAQRFKIISELPFDSFRMRSSVLIEATRGVLKNKRILIVKGAPESILKICSKFGGSFKKSELKEEISNEGENGRRVLAIAYKKMGAGTLEISSDQEKGMTFLGYYVFEDPLKVTAKEAIDLSKKLGVRIKIITGDSKEVALFTAKKAGLASGSGDVISGDELMAMVKDDFEFTCDEKTVFARISPDLKHKIIKTLQKKYGVGFLGEGVNDAPALKTADVGIAVAEASDVAREAADVVLLEKDLRVIVNGIKDGRKIFSNINKYIKCALASNFGNFYSIAAISIFINFLPMLPVQILLGNILSDFPLISIAGDSVDVDELKRPKAYQLHMVLPLIISLALVSTVFDFIFFSIFYRQEPGVIQTLWFIESILTEILLIYIIRTKGLFYKAKKPSFWLVWLTIIDGIFVVALPFLKIGQAWFHFVVLPIVPLLTVFFLIGMYFIVSEIVKLIYFHYWKPKNFMVS